VLQYDESTSPFTLRPDRSVQDQHAVTADAGQLAYEVARCSRKPAMSAVPWALAAHIDAVVRHRVGWAHNRLITGAVVR
jgi:hypothetical protein